MIEQINCNLCGSQNYKILYKNTLEESDLKRNIGFSYAEGSRKMGQIVRCNSCGLVYINPREKNIENRYEELESEIYSKSKNERIETFEEELKKIEKITQKKGKILDIGFSLLPNPYLKNAIGLDIALPKKKPENYEKAFGLWAILYRCCGTSVEF